MRQPKNSCKTTDQCSEASLFRKGKQLADLRCERRKPSPEEWMRNALLTSYAEKG